MNPRKLSSRMQVALTVVGLVALTALGYFFLVSPKRSAAAELGEQIAATQAEIVTRRASLRGTPPPVADVGAAELFELTRAMPDQPAIDEAILELNGIARSSGIVLRSIAAQPAVPGQPGYQVVQLKITFDGRYSAVSGFMERLRNLVRVERGELRVRGRLFAVQGISLSEGKPTFPRVQASATVNAFVYSAATAAAAPGDAEPATTPPPAGGGTEAAGGAS